MVIAKATNLLFRKLPMVIRRLGNWSVLAMFKNVLVHGFAKKKRGWDKAVFMMASQLVEPEG